MTKKSISRLLQASLMCCLAVLFTACEDFATEDNPTPSYLSLNTDDVTLKVGDTYVRKPIVAGSAVVAYSSSDETIATVDQEGKVTANNPGTVTITAQTTGYNAEGKKIYLAEEKSYKVTVKADLSTPLTLQVLTPGTIVVNKPQPGMQYSLNGGAKTAVPDGTAINGGDLSVGDKVSFYGDGTNITTYYDGTTYTTIKGGTAEVKVYGNIMSLVDEENFATNKTLTADYTFVCLFEDYTTLKDASDLLLPATTLAASCYNSMFNSCTSLTTAPAELPAMTVVYMCYAGMFINCTSLTTAPKLPATTLASGCYYRMFKSCTSLTAAYVKAAFTTSSYACSGMFDGCTNAATLHTTAANQASWDGVMGPTKTWSTWTTASDWTD